MYLWYFTIIWLVNFFHFHGYLSWFCFPSRSFHVGTVFSVCTLRVCLFFFYCSNYLIAPVWIITLSAIRRTADLLVQYPVCRKREETVLRKWKRPGDWAPALWRSFLRIGQWYFALFYQRVNQITWRRGLSFTF